jgi:uncharacterized small protein (DUF1192 family)
MSDIVERNIVGRIIEWQEQQETYDPEPWDLLCHAVDEIERLRAELNQYQAAGIPATVYERNKELLRDCVAKDAEIERLRAALERAREAIAQAPEDAFGSVPPAHDHPGYWIRDELVHSLTVALEDDDE